MTGTIDNMAIALARIAEEAEQRTGTLDLSDLGLESLPEALFELQHLRVLNLGISDPWKLERRLNHIDAQRDRLGCLVLLEALSVLGSDLSSLVPIQSLHHLQSLNCCSTRVGDLTPLAGLTDLPKPPLLQHPGHGSGAAGRARRPARINCSDTQVADLAPLAGLAALQPRLRRHPGRRSGAAGRAHRPPKLFCSGTQVSDLGPLAGLAALENLTCSSTQVSDLGPLAGIAALQWLDCSSTQVSDLGPLAGLAALETSTAAEPRSPISGRWPGSPPCRGLFCSSTQVSDSGR